MTKKRRALIVISSVMASLLFIVAVLQSGVWIAQTWRPWRPDYPMQDVSALLDKDELTDEDYDLLFRQTGLTRLGVDGLLSTGRVNRLLEIQKDYFGEFEVERISFAPFLYWEKMDKVIHTAVLEDGDVIVSPSTHFSFVRFGYAALVTDADRHKPLLEAIGYDAPSDYDTVGSFTCRPAFMVLRLKADKEVRYNVARWAEQNLVGIEYDLFVGVFSKKYVTPIKKTHCSHIVWYAFKQFGYDVDADGGGIVTPQDISQSKLFDVVQIYGFDPEKLWA